jgi:hypothetical protein
MIGKSADIAFFRGVDELGHDVFFNKPPFTKL